MSKTKEKSFDELSAYEVLKLALDAAMDYVKKRDEERVGKKKDRRLRNTKLLLSIYRDLKTHVEETNSTFKTLKAKDILEEFDVYGGELDEEKFVQAIYTSSKRTGILMYHIDEMISIYKIKCQHRKREKIYKAITLMYMEELPQGKERYTLEELAEIMNISVKTVKRYLKEGIEDLAILFFGIDASDF